MNELSSQELKELIDYVQENNSLENMKDLPLNRRIVKYVSFSTDTTTGGVWMITFSPQGNDAATTFRARDTNNMKEAIYEWLNQKLF